jgi:hypothetical protein
MAAQAPEQLTGMQRPPSLPPGRRTGPAGRTPAPRVPRATATRVPQPLTPLRYPGPAPDRSPGPGVTDADPIEHLLPVSGCTLRVVDLPGGARLGELYGPGGVRLDDARCGADGYVSGWFGRTGSWGTAWALAFGAGGAHEALEVGFASLRARRSVSVTGDQHGLWVAEVSGSFHAATILGRTGARTLRLHRALS